MAGHDELERLVERSRMLGADTTLVVHGGGNTSTKTVLRDHLDRARNVLLIKGSGTDLRTASAGDFPALYLDDILPLRTRDSMSDEEMMDYLARCLADPAGRRPSIETLLHAFLPASHVDHVHADAVCALTNTPDGRKAVAGALGEDIAYVEFIRPGFDLSKQVAELAEHRAVVLAHHGLVTWGNTHEESYELTLELVDRAEDYLATRGAPAPRPLGTDLEQGPAEELLLTVRGRLSRSRRRILRVDAGQRGIVDRPDVDDIAAAGPATADHILRITTGSVVVRDAGSAVERIEAFERDYGAYFDRHRHLVDADPSGVPYPMHEPLPRSFLVPGLGTIAVGRTRREAQVVSEVAARSHEVAATAIDAFGAAEALPEADIFGVDYWGLELFKLTLAAAPAELAGRIVIVTGAASGIGRGIALDLGRRGACVVLGDIDGDGLAETAAAIPDGVAVPGDLTSEAVIDELVRSAVREFGGLDAVVPNAGIGMTGNLADLSAEQWRKAFEVNTTSQFLLTKRVWPVFERQQLGGSLVYIVSKNAFAPGAGFGAYSSSKAAQMQLCRIAALEGGAIGVRANAVNPDAVFEGSNLWSPELRAERAAAHGVEVDELEAFYVQRNILRAGSSPSTWPRRSPSSCRTGRRPRPAVWSPSTAGSRPPFRDSWAFWPASSMPGRAGCRPERGGCPTRGEAVRCAGRPQPR
ncbi:MAG: SDR family NAD(P)-dependent oxidoreductase [Acidimicrobiales bacterium]